MGALIDDAQAFEILSDPDVSLRSYPHTIRYVIIRVVNSDSRKVASCNLHVSTFPAKVFSDRFKLVEGESCLDTVF